MIVSVDVPPARIVVGEKLFDTVNGVRTARTAAGAMTMPTPESRSPPDASMSRAEPNNAFQIVAGDALGFADWTRAAIAAAWGAAAEVP